MSFITFFVLMGIALLFSYFLDGQTGKCHLCGATYKKKCYRMRGGGSALLGITFVVLSSRDSFEFFFGMAAILLGIFVFFKKEEPHVCSSDELDVEATKSDSVN